MNIEGTTAKFGTDLVVNEQGVDREAIRSHATELRDDYGVEGLIIVTSGAVAAGRLRVESWGDDVSRYRLKTLAQLGHASITRAWEEECEEIGVRAGGLLTTHNEIDDRLEGPVLLDSVRESAKIGVVSIVNENDALSVVELMKLLTGGENDGLAAHIAIAFGCARLRLFTKSGGILDDNGCLVDTVTDTNYFSTYRMLYRRAQDKQKTKVIGNGRGGAHTKLKWAKRAANHGIDTEILRPRNRGSDQSITKVVVG